MKTRNQKSNESGSEQYEYERLGMKNESFFCCFWRLEILSFQLFLEVDEFSKILSW